MRKIASILAAAAFAVLLVATPIMAQPVTEAGDSGTKIEFGPGVVLYDQTSAPPSGNGAPDQDFEAAFDAYDCRGADDFTVTDPNWTINQVQTVGTQSIGGTPSGVNVWFYPDMGGAPGATPTCEYLNIATASPTSLDITLPTGCVLPMGVHWVAVQVVQDFGGNGQHFWSGVSLAGTNGNPGVWENANNGFGTGCTTWTTQSTCGVGGGVADDWLFALIGDPVPVDLQSFDVE